MSYLLLFLAAVFAEVASLVIAGSRLGALPTLGLLALSFGLGILLLTGRGLAIVTNAMGATAKGESVTPALVDGALLAIAGILFITPGFASDLAALILLVPPVRGRLRARSVAWLGARMSQLNVMTVPGRGAVAADDVIDVVGVEVATESTTPSDRDDPARLPG